GFLRRLFLNSVKLNSMAKVLFSFIASLITVVGWAQVMQSTGSNMKFIYNVDNSIGPPYITPFGSIESRVEELPNNSLQIFNIYINSWGLTTYVFPYHINKFRFTDTSDIGIDSGLVLSTGRTVSDSLFW